MKLIRPAIALGCLLLAILLIVLLPGEEPFVPPVIEAGDSVDSLSESVVNQHSVADDCWTIVDGKVYDITSYVPFHPGGKAEIISICGVDGTALFTGVDPEGREHSQNAHNLLSGYYVGDLGETIISAIPEQSEVTPEPAPVEEEVVPVISLFSSVVAEHAVADDCWTIVNGKVYDITSYVPFHPGGRAEIVAICGVDGTALFTGSVPEGRKHSQNAHNLLSGYYVGDLGGTVSDVTLEVVTTSFEESIEAEYPGAKIEESSFEDDGEVEGKFFWRGQHYEFEADALGNLLEVKLS